LIGKQTSTQTSFTAIANLCHQALLALHSTIVSPPLTQLCTAIGLINPEYDQKSPADAYGALQCLLDNLQTNVLSLTQPDQTKLEKLGAHTVLLSIFGTPTYSSPPPYLERADLTDLQTLNKKDGGQDSNSMVFQVPTADDQGCSHKEWKVQDILEHIAPRGMKSVLQNVTFTRDEVRRKAKFFLERIGQSSDENRVQFVLDKHPNGVAF
jgi:hypothetical protein